MGHRDRGEPLGRRAWGAGSWLEGQAQAEFGSVLPGEGREG